MADVDRLCRALGHRFDDPALLAAALTHRSADRPNNERLEFLGDAVLSAVITEALYRRRPRADEGELSRLRASLVNGKTLAALARELGVGDCLRLGGGELKSGGFRRASILADALEALFGAAFLDSDFATVRALILRLYRDRFDALPAPESLKDPKTRLQELLQQRGLPLPAYSVIEVSGADHARRFRVSCEAAALRETADGSSRRAAEQAAADRLLAALADSHPARPDASGEPP